MDKKSNIDKNNCQKICKFLAQVLANTYVLYVKTQNFHWNLEGPRFYSLHKMFQEQYEQLALAIDEIAERIRMMGEKSPGSLKEFLNLTELKEAKTDLSEDEMLKNLLKDHDTVVNSLRPKIPEIQKYGDEGSSDLLIDLLRAHEKFAWMLRSHFTH